MTTEETPLIHNRRDTVYDRFSPGRKKLVVFVVSLSALVTFFTSGVIIPTIPQIVEELNSTEDVIGYAVAIYMFANAIGSLVATRYSGFYGRRPIYLWWLPVMIIGSIGVAKVQSAKSLIIWRFVQALGASPGTSVGAGVVGDVYRLEERGTALGVYFGIGLVEYALAPTIGGITAYYWSWRTIHAFIAIISLALFAFMTLFFPETIHPGTKGLDQHREAGRIHSRWRPVILNPIAQLSMLRSPNIMIVSFLSYTGMLTDFALLVPLPYTIAGISFPNSSPSFLAYLLPASQGKRYGIENEALLGACFLPLGIGKVAGALPAGWMSDKVVVKYRKKRGYWYPEDRLRASLFSCYLPLTVLGSALITKYIPGTSGLVLNLVCLFSNGVGSDITITPCGTYVVDVLHAKSAEATAAVNAFRAAAIGASTALLLPMVNAYGYLFTNLMVALVTLLALGLTILTIAHGEDMRNWLDIGFSTADDC